MRKRLCLAMATVCLAVFALAGNAGAVKFQYQDLSGDLGAGSVPVAINDTGQIAGTTINPSGGFLWTPGSGLQTFSGTNMLVAAMNNSGQVVGMSSGHAFLWTSAQGMTDLGTLGGSQSRALGISDGSTVVGGSHVNALTWHAFLWTGGLMVDMTPAGGPYTEARVINKNHQIAGATGTNLCLLSIGNPPQILYSGGFAIASGINSQGNIVGEADIEHLGGLGQAFFYDLGVGVMTNLTPGDYGAGASGINDANQVVGHTGTNITYGAFFWSPSTGLKDLNTLVELPVGVKLATAVSINNQGKIVGSTLTGQPYLLTPMGSSPGVVLLLSD